MSFLLSAVTESGRGKVCNRVCTLLVGLMGLWEKRLSSLLVKYAVKGFFDEGGGGGGSFARHKQHDMTEPTWLLRLLLLLLLDAREKER
jgi:hypothetical protein